MSQIPSPGSTRQRIRKLAISFAERYQASPPKVSDSSQVSNFYVLVDLMTFFDEVFSQRPETALAVFTSKTKYLKTLYEPLTSCIFTYRSSKD